jgi:hypothetical protein
MLDLLFLHAPRVFVICSTICIVCLDLLFQSSFCPLLSTPQGFSTIVGQQLLDLDVDGPSL